MIDTLEFFEELKEALEPNAAKKIAELLGRLYRELSNTVTKAEFEKLTGTVSGLGKHQKELAESPEKTEKEIRKLTRRPEDTKEQPGALSETVGYTLENKTLKVLPESEIHLAQMVLKRSSLKYFTEIKPSYLMR